MKFINVSGINFRNLKIENDVNIDNKQVVLVGKNGQGKTNFLELLYLLCYGNSFRTTNLKEAIKFKENNFFIQGVFEDEKSLKRKITFLYKNGKKIIKIDDKQITDRKALIYNIPCIVFSHSDINFVNGFPESRRKFFNQTLSMYDSLYFDDLRYYTKIVRQKNIALKEQKFDLLPIYDELLAKYGQIIMNARIKAIYEMNQIFPLLYEKVSSISNVRIEYTPSWKDCSTEEEIFNKLEKVRDRDIKLMFNSTGIHRDKFEIITENGDLATIGSTGQLRLASLVLRATQCQFFKMKTNKAPVLLVDDVLLELDIEKRELFLSLLEGYSQAFFTFLPKEKYFNENNKNENKTLSVSEGGLF